MSSQPKQAEPKKKVGHFIVIGSNEKEDYIGPFPTVEAAQNYAVFITNSQWWENILMQPLGAIK